LTHPRCRDGGLRCAPARGPDRAHKVERANQKGGDHSRSGGGFRQLAAKAVKASSGSKSKNENKVFFFTAMGRRMDQALEQWHYLIPKKQ